MKPATYISDPWGIREIYFRSMSGSNRSPFAAGRSQDHANWGYIHMTGLNRRTFLLGVGALGMAAAGLREVSLAQTAPSKTRLILLGTGGGPRVTIPGRSKPANLLIIN